MPAPRPPTAKDVARASGVSLSCAAAALRNAPTVKPATRQRILATAQQLGYRPNTAASLLASQRATPAASFLGIGVLTLRLDQTGMSPEPTMIEDFRAEGARRGWLVETRLAATREQAAAHLAEWQARGFEGLIFWRVYPPTADPGLDTRPFSVVCAQRDLLRHGYDVVRTSHYLEQFYLLGRVRERGYHRIGMVWRHHGPEPSVDDHARLAAMMVFREGLPAGERLPILHLPFPTDEKGWRAGATRLAAYVVRRRVDALVGFNTGDLASLVWKGFEIPRDLGFAALSCQPDETQTVFGTLGEHYAAFPLLLTYLARKIRLGERGPSPHPLEQNFRCPEVCGASLPDRREG